MDIRPLLAHGHQVLDRALVGELSSPRNESSRLNALRKIARGEHLPRDPVHMCERGDVLRRRCAHPAELARDLLLLCSRSGRVGLQSGPRSTAGPRSGSSAAMMSPVPLPLPWLRSPRCDPRGGASRRPRRACRLVRSLMSCAICIMRSSGDALREAGRAEIDQHVALLVAAVVEASRKQSPNPTW